MSQVWSGSPCPLGATHDGSGTNFAIFSEVAEKIEFCLFGGLFDEAGSDRGTDPAGCDAFAWHDCLPPTGPGRRRSCRARRPRAHARGLRGKPDRLPPAPDAEAADGPIGWELFSGRDFDGPDSLHTAEGGRTGPMPCFRDICFRDICFRDIDDAAYHRAAGGAPAGSDLTVQEADRKVGEDAGKDAGEDIHRLRPDRVETNDAAWESDMTRSLGVYLNGHGFPDPDTLGEPVVDDSFLMFCNAHHEPIGAHVPPANFGATWEVIVDTRISTTEIDTRLSKTAIDPADIERHVTTEEILGSDARSTVVLRRVG